jgi:hypothetical protein
MSRGVETPISQYPTDFPTTAFDNKYWSDSIQYIAVDNIKTFKSPP